MITSNEYDHVISLSIRLLFLALMMMLSKAKATVTSYNKNSISHLVLYAHLVNKEIVVTMYIARNNY